jgi:hypothetical protein
MSGRNESISRTYRRPSASQSTRIGDSIIGSDATSSTWNPGGIENDFISSAAESAGDVGVALRAGRHGLPGSFAVPA